MLVLEEDDPDLYTKIQDKTLIRQYDLLTNDIEIGLKQGSTALDKYMLWALNHVAVANIHNSAAVFGANRSMSEIIFRRISTKYRI